VTSALIISALLTCNLYRAYTCSMCYLQSVQSALVLYVLPARAHCTGPLWIPHLYSLYCIHVLTVLPTSARRNLPLFCPPHWWTHQTVYKRTYEKAYACSWWAHPQLCLGIADNIANTCAEYDTDDEMGVLKTYVTQHIRACMYLYMYSHMHALRQ
jgi:hypothetical protein